MTPASSTPLLSIKGLTVSLTTAHGVLRVLEDVTFDIARESVVALVGESGSGKSLLALSILQLLPSPIAHIEAGQILWNGVDLVQLPEGKLEALRGSEIAMIFQEPMNSLNPVYTIGSQIAEALRIHKRARGRAARERAIELLSLVGIPAPKLRVDAYPHELSGGMRQRALIAMALACEPKLLIADEPTTALDVTVQAQILDLLRRLQQNLKMSTLFITHDMSVVAEIASQAVVLYSGRVVELASVSELFRSPQHPYSKGLLASIPGKSRMQPGQRRLNSIPGSAFDQGMQTTGCRFASRCSVHQGDMAGHPLCRQTEPELLSAGTNRWARCHYLERILSVTTAEQP